MAYEYGNFGGGAGDVVQITEQDLLPLLVLWLMFVVNPDIIKNATAADYTEIGTALNLTPQYVEGLFNFVRNDAPTSNATQTAAAFFQKIVGNSGPGPYQGGGSSCGQLSTILKLASKGAISVWG